MKVLIACEYSGTVRNEFLKRGHDAWSCDLEPPHSLPERHFQCDVLSILKYGWDLMVAHPPCERLCVSGARWKYEKTGWIDEQYSALRLVKALLNAPIKHIALENPVGIISTKLGIKPTQIIQPWMFGHGELKTTCLWLKNLPRLRPTQIVEGREQRVWRLPPTPDRKKLRAFRYTGIANAMAEQWGDINNISRFVNYSQMEFCL